MKRQIFLGTCATLLLGFGAYLNFQRSQADRQASDLTLADLEVMAIDPDKDMDGGEEGEYITCYCALMSSSSCAVNNNGRNKCAGGVNVKCWEYNRNCN